jgi:LPXTG-motif cell wall-anchored protein
MSRSTTSHTPTSHTSSGRVTVRLAAAVALVGSVTALLASGQPATAGIVPTVDLATSSDYSVLAATTVTNTNESVIGQSVGLSPGTAVIGFPPGVVSAPGVIAVANADTGQAQTDLTAAYLDAASRPVEFTQVNPDLVGQTLLPGVYAGTAKAALSLSGQLVLDGQGNPDAVFIFQTDSTLITSTGSTIALINGASECNVFWQVGSSATLGSGSFFVGNILALTSVTVESSTVVHGRALAQTGAVTLDNNVFTQPSCAPSTDLTPTATAPSITTPSTTTSSTTLPATTITQDVGGVSTTIPLDVEITLPDTGATSATSSIGMGAIVALLLGAAALFLARRRQTA